MEGEDINDSNCIDFANIEKIRYRDRVFNKELNNDMFSLKGIKVGVVDEFDIEELDNRNRKLQNEMINLLQDRGAIIKRISIPLIKYSLPFHFTLIPSEATSNFDRYDGLKYGYQPELDGK
jgi:aspartyl-tRNA(Asn)/glutamyl-tRNA(Gln) amidotransferase subunit A